MRNTTIIPAGIAVIAILSMISCGEDSLLRDNPITGNPAWIDLLILLAAGLLFGAMEDKAKGN